jgi:hypothetical protein
MSQPDPFQVATDHLDLTLEINEDVPTTRNKIKTTKPQNKIISILNRK